MKTVTATELKGHIYDLLDEVLTSGIPLVVSKNGKKLTISPEEPTEKLANLVYRPEVMTDNPEDLVTFKGHYEWNELQNLLKHRIKPCTRFMA